MLSSGNRLPGLNDNVKIYWLYKKKFLKNVDMFK